MISKHGLSTFFVKGNANMNYKPSKFNYNFQIDEKTVGLYNTFTQALAALRLEEFSALEHGGDLLPAADQRSCIENGFLVPEGRNENALLDQARADGILNSNTAVYRILTTSACNARCFYCYENRNQAISMDRKTATQVARFIQERSGNTSVRVQWFGGEPLLNPEIIEYMTKLLKQQISGNNLQFSIITNGSLINDELIHKMTSDWNISQIQITLDGTEKEYARRKNYVGLADPFRAVLQNIQLAIQSGIRTVIRLNYDYNNYLDILQLIERLGRTLPHAENLRVYAYHLYSTDSQNPVDQSRKEEWFTIQDALILHRFTTPEQAFSLWTRRTRCFACQTKGFVITPEGVLFKCPMAMADSNAKVGDVWNGITNKAAMARWCNIELKTQCRTCVFMPICQGGCRAGELGYSSEVCFPQKEFLDEVLRKRLWGQNT